MAEDALQMARNGATFHLLYHSQYSDAVLQLSSVVMATDSNLPSRTSIHRSPAEAFDIIMTKRREEPHRPPDSMCEPIVHLAPFAPIPPRRTLENGIGEREGFQ